MSSGAEKTGNLCYKIWKLLKTNCWSTSLAWVPAASSGTRIWRVRAAAGPGQPEPQNSRSLHSRHLVRGLGATQAGRPPGERRKQAQRRHITHSVVWPHFPAPWVTYRTLVPAPQQTLNRDEEQQIGLSLTFPAWPHPSTSISGASPVSTSSISATRGGFPGAASLWLPPAPATRWAPSWTPDRVGWVHNPHERCTHHGPFSRCQNNKTTWVPCQSIPWAAKAPGTPQPEPRHRLGSPNKMQKPEDSLERLTRAQAWCSSAESGAVPPAVLARFDNCFRGQRGKALGRSPVHGWAQAGSLRRLWWSCVTARTSCAHPSLVQPAVLLPRLPLAPMSLRGPESVATTSIQSEHRLKGHHRCAIMENGAFLSPVVGNHLLPALLDLYTMLPVGTSRGTQEKWVSSEPPTKRRLLANQDRLEAWRGCILQAFVDVSLGQIRDVGLFLVNW